MLYNTILEKIILPVGDFFTGGIYIKTLRKWRKIALKSETELEELSTKNLTDLLKYVTQTIPYYKPYAKFQNDDPKEWIKSFPILKKKEIKDNFDAIYLKDKSKPVEIKTSGSSGEQGISYMSKSELSAYRAIQTMWWEWSGWYLGKPLFQMGMSGKRGLIKSIKDLLFRTRYNLAFGLSSKESLDMLEKQKNVKNFHVGGYASSIYLLAKSVNEEKINNIKFDYAISWGDKMFAHYRSEIKNAFDCNVIDTYGCSEGIMIAAQKDLDYYYIMSPHVYLELVDKEGNEVEDGQLGLVVATRLDARTMPLVRYYTGDLAVKLPKNKYPKQRELNFPLLERVIGRDTDIVYTESKKYMIVHFFTGIFEFYDEIKQFRVIQRTLKSIEIEYIKGTQFNENVLKKIEESINSHLNEIFPIIWKEVTTIPNSPSGKPQIIVSLLNKK